MYNSINKFEYNFLIRVFNNNCIITVSSRWVVQKMLYISVTTEKGIITRYIPLYHVSQSNAFIDELDER